MSTVITEPAGGPPGRTAWRALGVVASVLVLLLAGLLAWGWLAPRRTEERTQTYRQPVGRVQVEVDAGDVTVVGASAGGEVTVERRLAWRTARTPTVAETWSGDALRVTGRCPSTGLTLGLGGDCSIELVLRVPPQVAVEVRTDAGAVRLRDLTGEVQVAVSAGDVSADALAGPLRIRSDSGEISAAGLRGDRVEVRADAGEIRLGFAEPPAAVSVVSSAGDVTVELAPGSYRVSADTDAGRRRVEVTNDPAAARTVTARTEAGDIHIRYAD
ncbi:MAG TPA: DUF4097 family beta strand repeat-containing protein [Pilimelia sp.]|nr:DUF4097 family beta strand repeat-containing protein [Pilimelia sp.]